jgi:hypothetical protein
MNRHTSRSTDQHQQILLLLPWYLNQSLEQDERQRVETHLHNCMLCNRELAALRKLAAAVKHSSDMEVAAEASFAKLRPFLKKDVEVRQNLEPSVKQSAPGWFGKRANAAPALSGHAANRTSRLLRLSGSTVTRFAITVSILLAMIPLIMQYGRSPVTNDYYTLSAARPESPAGTKLRVVFAKSLPDAGIDALLEQIHGQLIEGPNNAGAYTVKLDDGKGGPEVTAAVALLRSQQNVLLVEPVLEP